MIVRPFLFRGKEHNFLFSWKKLNINHHIHIPQWSNFSSKVLHKISHTLVFQKIIFWRSLSHFLYPAYNKNYSNVFKIFWNMYYLFESLLHFILTKIWSLCIPGLNGAQTRALEKDEPEWHVRHLKYSNYCPNRVILELDLDHSIFHVGSNMGYFLGYISWKKNKEIILKPLQIFSSFSIIKYSKNNQVSLPPSSRRVGNNI